MNIDFLMCNRYGATTTPAGGALNTADTLAQITGFTIFNTFVY